jgi:hypothetical protein
VLYVRAVPSSYKKDNWGKRFSSVRESEESALLEAVTRKRLVKTLQAGRDLAGAVVICKLRRHAMAL